MFELGVLSTRLELNDNLSPGLKRAENALSSFARRITGRFEALAYTISTSLTYPFEHGTLTHAIRQFTDFERALKNAQAVAGHSKEKYEEIEAAILNIGRASQYGAKEIALAYYEIVSGVSDSTKHLSILEAAARTAAAGQANLAATTQGLIFMMNAYNFEASQASRVSDVLTRTVGMGVGSMDQFVAAMASSVAIMKQANVTIEDYGLMVAFLTSRGLTASEAATALQSLANAFLKPNTEMESYIGNLLMGNKALEKHLGIRKEIVRTEAAEITKLYSKTGDLLAIQTAEFSKKGTTKVENKINAPNLLKHITIPDLLRYMTELDPMNIPKALGRVEAQKAYSGLMSSEFAGFRKEFFEGLSNATDKAFEIQEEALYVRFAKLRARFEDLFLRLGKRARPTVNWAIDHVASFMDFIHKVNEDALPNLLARVALVPIASILAGPLGFILSMLHLIVSTVAEIVVPSIKYLIDQLATSITGTINGVFEAVGKGAGGVFEAVGKGAKSIFQTVWKALFPEKKPFIQIKEAWEKFVNLDRVKTRDTQEAIEPYRKGNFALPSVLDNRQRFLKDAILWGGQYADIVTGGGIARRAGASGKPLARIVPQDGTFDEDNIGINIIDKIFEFIVQAIEKVLGIAESIIARFLSTFIDAFVKAIEFVVKQIALPVFEFFLGALDKLGERIFIFKLIANAIRTTVQANVNTFFDAYHAISAIYKRLFIDEATARPWLDRFLEFIILSAVEVGKVIVRLFISRMQILIDAAVELLPRLGKIIAVLINQIFSGIGAEGGNWLVKTINEFFIANGRKITSSIRAFVFDIADALRENFSKILSSENLDPSTKSFLKFLSDFILYPFEKLLKSIESIAKTSAGFLPALATVFFVISSSLGKISPVLGIADKALSFFRIFSTIINLIGGIATTLEGIETGNLFKVAEGITGGVQALLLALIGANLGKLAVARKLLQMTFLKPFFKDAVTAAEGPGSSFTLKQHIAAFTQLIGLAQIIGGLYSIFTSFEKIAEGKFDEAARIIGEGLKNIALGVLVWRAVPTATTILFNFARNLKGLLSIQTVLKSIFNLGRMAAGAGLTVLAIVQIFSAIQRLTQGEWDLTIIRDIAAGLAILTTGLMMLGVFGKSSIAFGAIFGIIAAISAIGVEIHRLGEGDFIKGARLVIEKYIIPFLEAIDGLKEPLNILLGAGALIGLIGRDIRGVGIFGALFAAREALEALRDFYNASTAEEIDASLKRLGLAISGFFLSLSLTGVLGKFSFIGVLGAVVGGIIVIVSELKRIGDGDIGEGLKKVAISIGEALANFGKEINAFVASIPPDVKLFLFGLAGLIASLTTSLQRLGALPAITLTAGAFAFIFLIADEAAKIEILENLKNVLEGIIKFFQDIVALVKGETSIEKVFETIINVLSSFANIFIKLAEQPAISILKLLGIEDAEERVKNIKKTMTQLAIIFAGGYRQKDDPENYGVRVEDVQKNVDGICVEVERIPSIFEFAFNELKKKFEEIGKGISDWFDPKNNPIVAAINSFIDAITAPFRWAKEQIEKLLDEIGYVTGMKKRPTTEKTTSTLLSGASLVQEEVNEAVKKAAVSYAKEAAVSYATAVQKIYVVASAKILFGDKSSITRLVENLLTRKNRDETWQSALVSASSPLNTITESTEALDVLDPPDTIKAKAQSYIERIKLLGVVAFNTFAQINEAMQGLKDFEKLPDVPEEDKRKSLDARTRLLAIAERLSHIRTSLNLIQPLAHLKEQIVFSIAKAEQYAKYGMYDASLLEDPTMRGGGGFQNLGRAKGDFQFKIIDPTEAAAANAELVKAQENTTSIKSAFEGLGTTLQMLMPSLFGEEGAVTIAFQSAFGEEGVVTKLFRSVFGEGGLLEQGVAYSVEQLDILKNKGVELGTAIGESMQPIAKLMLKPFLEGVAQIARLLIAAGKGPLSGLGLIGAELLSVVSGIETRDKGGHGKAGVPYLIGRGAQPELFIPSSDGTFIPRADRFMGGGGGGIHVDTINVYGATNAREMLESIREELRIRNARF